MQSFPINYSVAVYTFETIYTYDSKWPQVTSKVETLSQEQQHLQ